MSAYDPDLDFNFEEDAKLPGLVPNGTYHGAITGVNYDDEKKAIVWTVALNGNGGMCTDDETPIDGNTLTFTNWLPRPGDDKERTSSGKQTKRQAKINMMAEFMKKMQFTQTTVGEVLESVQNAEFVGTDVDVQVGCREWQGSMFNEIQRMFVPINPEF